jgi:23S rRNA pseudouridine2457 synthase
MIVLFNKPYGVLCQFTDRAESPRRTLAEFELPTPGESHPLRRRAHAQGRAGRRHLPGMDRQRDIYPAGRLDYDSEGLVLLTDDGALAHRITDPRRHWPKTYLVQVEGVPRDAALHELSDGIELKDGRTRPAQVRAVECAPSWLWPRDPPVRFRKTVADSWIEITLREGRNRQVRRMTAAIGHPTLRLIRVRIGEYALDDLAPGQWQAL